MTFKNVFKLSLLELIRFRKITFFLIFNFTLGLIGFFFLQIFQQSLSAQSAEKAQVILGGDISINARRAFSAAEVKEWESQFKFEKKSHYYSFFSMLRSSTDSRLVNAGAFDDHFPLYGEFKLSSHPFSSDRARVWTDPEVQEMMQLNIGDLVELGEAKFEFSGTIVDDPSRLFRGAGFAPRVLFHQKYLADSQLIKPGSTFNETWSYRLNSQQPVRVAKQNIEHQIQDPVVQIETVADSAQDSNRILKYFSDYLGLVALVSLGLCFLCGSYLLQWTFQTKKKSIAILKTLGLTDQKILILYLTQSLLIAIISSLTCIIIVKALLPLLQNLITEKFQLPVQLSVDFFSLILISLVGVLGPLLMTVPQILQIFDLQALELFQNSQTAAPRGRLYYLWVCVALSLFWILSVWQSHSVKIASGFVGALVVLIILFFFLNRVLLVLIDKIVPQFNWLIRYSLRGLTRRPGSTSLVFTTMSLATLILSLLPHLKSSILAEIRPEQTSSIPQLFLFDIQPEQVVPLQQLAASELNINLKMSPLVRSRILKVNDIPYERIAQETGFQTREAEAEARFRNRGVNLSYSDSMQPSESVVAGKFISEHNNSTSLPEISLEEKYADRVGVRLGDQMTFDIQGIEMKAQVTSFRKVRWTSFQPNFFILFPKGVLEEAPQVFLTSVSLQEGRNPFEQKELIKKFQQRAVQKFKNVSMIDVSRSIQNSLKYIDQMALGLQLMAWLAVAVGIFVFIILLNTQIRERLAEMNLMQILGATQIQIRNAIFIQFVVLLSFSLLSGVMLGLVGAWLLLTYFFDIHTTYDAQYLLFLGALLIPICLFAIYNGLKPLQRLNPMDLIRQT